MLKRFKHHLPHWELEGAVYFITFRAIDDNFNTEERQVILNILLDGHRNKLDLIAVQVMTNHVHLIIRLLDEVGLSKTMQWVKGVTAREVNKLRGRKGSIWMVDYFDRIIRSESNLNEKLKYMFENPVRAGLIDKPEDWTGWFIRKPTKVGSPWTTIDKEAE